ncbi:MAG: Mov34/MPN/PAD-1 family protein [Armatimonadetes bacterium]|nr:Mov34/MPN/PAD-1 family protein [Armatimonadota bacterium]
MASSGYEYTIALIDDRGSVLRCGTIVPDWDRAAAWTGLQAVRRDGLNFLPPCSDASVDPIWHPEAGEPCIGGFRVSVPGANGRRVSCDFSNDYWSAAAMELAAQARGGSAGGADRRILYLVTARPMVAASGASASRGFTIEESAQRLSLAESSLENLRAGSRQFGLIEADDIPVFMPERVLRETAHLARAAGGSETGGVLLGHLRRDSSVPEAFVEVTAQIPAKHTAASATRVLFTEQTWTDARSVLSGRGRGELMLGWWHSHPSREWSGGGSDCGRRSGDFLSPEDRRMHETVFPAAYSVALLVSDVQRESGDWASTWSVYGWRYGVIEYRGFYLR